MTPHLHRRGYDEGSGHISPDRKRFLLNIPKNASSYLSGWVGHYDWDPVIIDNGPDWDSIEELIVPLRDPVNRWISGMAQYLHSYILSFSSVDVRSDSPDMLIHDYFMSADQFIGQYTHVVERLLFDVIDQFDDHVYPQHEFFKNVRPTATRKFFNLDDPTFDQQFEAYTGLPLISGLDRNAKVKYDNINRLQTFFQDRLIVRPELVEKLKKHFIIDYTLLHEHFKDQH